MLTVTTTAAENTYKIGQTLAKYLHNGDVLCITGNLGAGKTVLVQGITAGLGISEPVTSPTFTVLNIYNGDIIVYHFDLYRLNRSEELEDIGFAEYTNSGGVVLIEWPDKFFEDMPEEYLQIALVREENENLRRIAINGRGLRYIKLCKELKKIAGTWH